MRLSHFFKMSFGILSALFLLSTNVLASEEVLKNFFSPLEKAGYTIEFKGFVENGSKGHIDAITISTKANDTISFSYQGVDYDNLNITADGSLTGDLWTTKRNVYKIFDFKGRDENIRMENFVIPEFSKLLDGPDFSVLSKFSDLKKLNEKQQEEAFAALKSFLPYFESFTAYMPKLSFALISVEKSSAEFFTIGKFQLDGLKMTSMNDGVLDEVRLSSFDYSLDLGPTNSISYSTGEVILKDYDYAALDHIVSRANYKDGKGDGVWKKISGDGIIHDYRTVSGPITSTVERLVYKPAYMKQTDEPLLDTFAGLLDFFKDRVLKETASAAQGGQETAKKSEDDKANIQQITKTLTRSLLSIYRSMKLDGVVYENFSVTSKEQFEIDIKASLMEMGAFSYDEGLEKFEFSGVHFKAGQKNIDGTPKTTVVNLEKLNIGQVVLPEQDNVLAGLEKLFSGDKSQNYQLVSLLSPTLGALEIAGLSVDNEGERTFNIDRLAISLENYIKLIPTDIKIDLAKVDVPLTAASDRDQVIKILKELGYEKLVVDGLIALKWDEATNDFTILPSNVDVQELGEIKLKGIIGNIPRQAIEDPEGAVAYLLGASLKEAEVSYSDASFANRFFESEAKKKQANADDLKRQYGALVALPLAFLQNPEFTSKAQNVVTSFLANPGTVNVTATPQVPVPLLGLGAMFQTNPGQIVETLQLDVQAQ